MKIQPKKCQKQQECLVQGFMYLTYRMAQIMGIAPVSFKKHPDGWRMFISPVLRAIQCTLITILNAFVIAGLVIDLMAGSDQSSRAHQSTRTLVWVSDIFTVILSSSIVIYGNLKKTVITMECLARIRKINSKIGFGTLHGFSCWWMYLMLFKPFLEQAILILPEYLIFIGLTIQRRRDLNSAYLYFFFHFTYQVVTHFRIHLMFCLLEVNKTLKCLNDQLENMADVELQTIATRPSKLTPGIVRHFIGMYDAVYQTIRLLDENYSFEMLMLLIISLQQLTMTPYNFIVNLESGSKCTLSLLAIQFCWICLHCLSFIASVEPCHRTKQEVARASYLAGQLITNTDNEQVLSELDKLSCYLSLEVSYSAMGICTISRSLIASSDDDELPSLLKKELIDDFFEPPKKKSRTMRSSTVGRCSGRDSTSYVSTNTDDRASTTHLIKIEVYDLKKIENIDQSDHWKHADVRVKFYTKSTNDDHHKKTRQLIYNITKGISNSPNCRKYSYSNKVLSTYL